MNFRLERIELQLLERSWPVIIYLPLSVPPYKLLVFYWKIPLQFSGE
jgi:hypothetical protein